MQCIGSLHNSRYSTFFIADIEYTNSDKLKFILSCKAWGSKTKKKNLLEAQQ